MAVATAAAATAGVLLATDVVEPDGPPRADPPITSTPLAPAPMGRPRAAHTVLVLNASRHDDLGSAYVVPRLERAGWSVTAARDASVPELSSFVAGAVGSGVVADNVARDLGIGRRDSLGHHEDLGEERHVDAVVVAGEDLARELPPAGPPAIATAILATRQDATFSSPAGPRRGSQAGVVRLDFVAGIAETRRRYEPPSIDEGPLNAIETRQWVYWQVPPARRARLGGRRWVRFPVPGGESSATSPAPFADPLGEARRMVGGDRLRRLGAATVRGVRVSQYAAPGIAGATNDYWVDDRGRLVRSVATSPSGLSPARTVLEVDVVAYDVDLSIPLPAASDTVRVRTVVAAGEIVRG